MPAYTKFFKSQNDGLADVDTDPLKVMLLSAYTVGSTQDTAQFVSNVLAVATQVSGAGYTAGGATLSTVTYVAAGHVWTLDCNDVAWPGLTASASYALFYVARAGSSAATQPVICYWDFGAPVVVNTLQVPVSGLLTATAG